MPFGIQELQQAFAEYSRFQSHALPHHTRFVFPFFSGTYFTYRKIDVMRVVAIAKSVSKEPSYLDVGCGYGDFLARIRERIPQAAGIEKEAGIFYTFQIPKPDYIEVTDVELMRQPIDVAFVGWMEPGVDFRKKIAKLASCIITTFDAGGQCGISGGCEYDEFGFKRVAWWRTPSWIDVNTELMNRYYTPSLVEEKKNQLAKLRSAHNFWYVYARPDLYRQIRDGLEKRLEKEQATGGYDFESVLDECGFHYKEELSSLTTAKRLWEVILD